MRPLDGYNGAQTMCGIAAVLLADSSGDVNTMLFDAQRASDRSWTLERLEREKQLLYARTGMTHWTRQPWWQLRVGRWLGLLAG